MTELDTVLRGLATEHDWPEDVLERVSIALRAFVPLAPDTTLDGANAWAPLTEAPPVRPASEGRYTDLGSIGAGGMGEVRRVRDGELNRHVAMKLLRSDLSDRPGLRARFQAEAQVAAQLQHPGIPPVHDAGTLPDGRPWFTMKEVRGRTLSELIANVHDAIDGGRWQPTADGWTLHRLVDAFAAVCDAIGYAHSRGVLHRDLKPDNIMVGAHGEVLVLDWGIAKLLGQEEDPEEQVTSLRDSEPSLATRAGAVTGTAAYMPPEQAMGEHELLSPASDVYALGVILFEILTGDLPYHGANAVAVITRMMLRDRPTVAQALERQHGLPPPLPEELVVLCDTAMAHEPEDRLADGKAFASGVRAWLEGAAKRARAEALVTEAQTAEPEALELTRKAHACRTRARALLATIPPWQDESAKAVAWALDDEAHRYETEARRIRWEAERKLQAALTHDAHMVDAIAGLAASVRREHEQAESTGDAPGAERAALRLQAHLEALPVAHPERDRGLTYLTGTGAIDLVTDPPGAEVMIQAYATSQRRATLGPARSLGHTPLSAVPVAMGSYLLTLRHPDRPPVHYPVVIERSQSWTGIAPGRTEAQVIRLPRQLDPDECYVPAGWFRSGGDPEATGSLTARMLWCHGFVIRRHPTTQAEWLAYVNHLVDQQDDEALAIALPGPRAAEGQASTTLYSWRNGRYHLPDGWHPREPALWLDWPAAMAFARYEAERTGKAWRLPGELEWEKAARGVDGRRYPWGDTFDASWACLGDSHPGDKRWAKVDDFPHDESPYGVRGLAGNVRDWCADAWLADGPPTPDDCVGPPVEGPPSAWRVRRGGSWGDMPGRARLADRDWYDPSYRYDYLGVRLARDED